MPTYVYRRPDGTTFEHFQKISDAPLTEDPETGVPVQRVISGGAGLQFKGSGFYLTDYVQKSGSADTAEPSGEPSKKEKAPKKATTESESKGSSTKAEGSKAATSPSTASGD